MPWVAPRSPWMESPASDSAVWLQALSDSDGGSPRTDRRARERTVDMPLWALPPGVEDSDRLLPMGQRWSQTGREASSVCCCATQPGIWLLLPFPRVVGKGRHTHGPRSASSQVSRGWEAWGSVEAAEGPWFSHLGND